MITYPVMEKRQIYLVTTHKKKKKTKGIICSYFSCRNRTMENLTIPPVLELRIMGRFRKKVTMQMHRKMRETVLNFHRRTIPETEIPYSRIMETDPEETADQVQEPVMEMDRTEMVAAMATRVELP